MIKKSDVRFGQLRAFLEAMGFTATREKKGWRLAHEQSGTTFYLRPYRDRDRVYFVHLFLVRCELGARGMLDEEAFEKSLTKMPA
ncbi:MAG: hypothetical protein ACREHD_00690 [Pirellulales bacterium]